MYCLAFYSHVYCTLSLSLTLPPQDFQELVSSRGESFDSLRSEGGREGKWGEYLVPDDMQSELPSDDSQPQSPGQSACSLSCVRYQWVWFHIMHVNYMYMCIYMYMHVRFLMRDEKKERKKQARSNKQTRQSNTAHPRQSLFLRKMTCLGWDSNPRHSTLQTERSTTELPMHVHVYYQCMSYNSAIYPQHQKAMTRQTFHLKSTLLSCPTSATRSAPWQPSGRMCSGC